MPSDKPRLSDAKSFREVLSLTLTLDAFEKARPHPGVDDNKAKRIRAQLIADLNDAMEEALAEHAELSAPPAPPPAPEAPPAQPTDPPASDASNTDPPPPPPPAADDAPAS